MAADSPEESSWTFYIQGFMCDIDEDDQISSSSEFETPYLVSDAASNAVKKYFSSGKLISKQNSLKKQKTTYKVVPAMDHDLEDTASSPVNSPKVSNYMNQFSNQKEKAKMNVAEVKRNYFSKRGTFCCRKGY